jgi:hypothetical protein
MERKGASKEEKGRLEKSERTAGQGSGKGKKKYSNPVKVSFFSLTFNKSCAFLPTVP